FGKAITVFQDHTMYLVGETRSIPSFPLDDGNGIPYYYPTGNTNYEGYISRFDLDISFVGVENIYSDDSKIKIYPNPSNGNFHLSISISYNETYQLILRDDLGRMIKDFGQ